ncbi:uncharacterized protein LOC129580875 [Paramacrobiotus metropolitanus]|uniref:uncharacterized protein LOC129580875 n=1 Tax=Paramacrobiotus metropolitanus TaxID=2943436 RepID=UPI0024462397|nr:uncharacterized protein LOC129580875 [Paramacrobiotus metropolitanus]
MPSTVFCAGSIREDLGLLQLSIQLSGRGSQCGGAAARRPDAFLEMVFGEQCNLLVHQYEFNGAGGGDDGRHASSRTGSPSTDSGCSKTAISGGLLAAGHFTLQTCSVPNGYWAMQQSASALLLKHVEQTFRLQFVKILSHEMYFVRRRYESPIGDEDIARVFERERQNPAFCGRLLEETKELESEPKRKKPSIDVEQGLNLPLEVLKEIFHSLDTVDRQCCRRTCPLWETILTSAELSRDLHVSRQQPSSPSQARWDCDNYAMYACIFKHITSATRTICIREIGTEYIHHRNLHYSNEALDLIKRFFADTGLRVDRFILYQRSIRMAQPAFDRWKFSAFSAEIYGQMSNLVPYCDRVIWKDYALTLLDKEDNALMGFRVPIATFTRGHVDEARIVDLLEQHLRWDGSPEEVQRISQHFTSRMDSKRKSEVKQILVNYQSSDPRPSAHYRNHQWTLDNVTKANVDKLNRFCLCALSRYMQDCSPGYSASAPDNNPQAGQSSGSSRLY